MRNYKYERTDDGGILVGTTAVAHGVYEHDVNGLDMRRDTNLLTTEGLNHMLDTEYHGSTQVTTWYVMLFSANATPALTWTAANFNSNATEFTNYTEGARQAFVETAAASGSNNSTSNKAAFTMDTGGGTIWGAALTSVSTKSSASGALSCATKFSAARTLVATDVINIGYTITLTSS